MTMAEFLRMVWPSEGFYALATPFTPKGATKPLYAHKVFDSIDAAIAAVDKIKAHKDVYFCVHSLHERQVWNPKKKDWVTKELGAFEVRTQTNMLRGKELFFDIDVEAGNPVKYPDQAAAITALRAFTILTGLPKPIVVSSGGGLHVHWPLTHDMTSNKEWKELAAKLKALAIHHRLLVDPMRTTDTSSVLRVPGTFNLKNPQNPREVRILTDGVTPTDNTVMTQLLDDALIRAGVHVAPQRTSQAASAAAILGSNTDIPSGPPVGFPALVEACLQVRNIVVAKGNVAEPFWYAMLGLVRYCEDGRKAAHYISKGHPDYDYDSTEQKLEQLESKAVGPTTCAKIESVNPGGCDGCPRKDVVKSPLTAARYTETAPDPIIPAPAHIPEAVEIEIPPPPRPFLRLKSGAIAIEVGKKDEPDKRETEIILPYDFHPVRRMTDDTRDVETHIWSANLPRVGYTHIMLDADSMYDTRKLSTCLANKGIFPHGDSINLLRSYMVAYINTLQAATDAEALQSNLGWNDDYTAFVLPSKTLLENGTAKPTNLSVAAERATSAVRKLGSLDQQVALMKFFNHPDYAANQFSICAALGAPIFHATGHHGVVINMSGPPGASKSTTLYTGAALWGDPLSFCINGTARGATHMARDNRMAILSNLPQLVDEITRMQPKDAADLAMGVTQSEHRIRLGKDGVERKSVNSNKSTIMLCTANTSLYTILSSERADSTAESMRVFEMQFDLAGVHKKYEADEFLSQLRGNYGHIGEVFIAYVVTHRAKVTDRVREIMRAIDTTANIQSGERFWSAAAAAALAACEIANELGLLQYKPKVIWNWLIDKQLPTMRSSLNEQYTPPIGVLSEYMELVNGNMLVLSHSNTQHSNIPNIVRQPQNSQLLARLEQDKGKMWILKKSFRDYCVRYGHNYTRIVDHLVAKGVIIHKHERKVLGANTEYAKGQSWCLTINMRHSDMIGEQLIPKKLEGKVLPFHTAVEEPAETA